MITTPSTAGGLGPTRQPSEQMPSEQIPIDLAPGLENLFTYDPGDCSYAIDTIQGQIPDWVRGTYYLNGPACFRRGDLDYRHWLDGDGRASALHFSDDGVTFTSRWIKSQKRRDEVEAGKAIYRTFGTGFDGDRLLKGVGLASPVNVSIYRWGGKLLAFGEQGLPWRLDPESLETLGEENFGRLAPVSPFSAHPHFDPQTDEMVSFGISYSAKQPALCLYRLTPEQGLVSRRRIPLDLPYSLHDFAISPRYACFFLAPYLLDMRKFLESGSTVQDALSWQPEHGTRLLVVDRESSNVLTSIPVGFGYSLHQINAFERDGLLVLDLLEMPEPAYPQYQIVPDLFTGKQPVKPVRLVVDVEAGRLVERKAAPFALAGDFPHIDPHDALRPCSRFWMLAISATGREGRKFFDQAVAFDWNQGGVTGTYTTPPGTYLGGEPTFIGDDTASSRNEEADGPRRAVILCQEIDALNGRGSFVLFDAFDLPAGPIARLRLEQPIPPGFHASFYPERSPASAAASDGDSAPSSVTD